jgi:hypothetical protein
LKDVFAYRLMPGDLGIVAVNVCGTAAGYSSIATM